MIRSPANTDAEEGLLASCIIDPAVIVRAEEHGITAASFFAPANGFTWEAVRAVNAKGHPVNEVTVAAVLDARNQLDAVGGLAGLNRMVDRVETTAHALYWVRAVREKALQRRLIAAAQTLVERAASEDLEALLARGEASIAELMAETAKGETDAPPPNPGKARAEAKLLAKLEEFKADLSRPPIRKPPVLKLMGKPVAKKGDLIVFSAPLKTGKSSVVAAMMGSPFALGGDYLGFESCNPEGEATLHLMTEESVEDHWDMVYRTAQRAGVPNLPDWFHSYHIRRLSSQDRRDALFSKAYAMAKKGPVRLIILDGVADFVDDVNDQRECKPFVDRLFKMIDELDCVLAVTIHTNPSLKPNEQAKATGWLGTILANKASNVFLNMKQEVNGEEIITVTTRAGRRGKGDVSTFKWNHELHRHSSITLGDGFEAVSSLDRAQAKVKPDLAVLARDIFDGWAGGSMPYFMIRERVMKVAMCAKSTAERKINDLVRECLVKKTDSGHYLINVQGDN